MKKAISLILTLTILISTATLLSSCGDGDGAPEGMQLVRGGEDIGYYMYAPEEWIVANQDELGIAAAYVSKLNNTSVTLSRAEFTEAGFAEYYKREMAKFPESLEFKEIADADGKVIRETKLGNSEAAWKVSYTYKYGTYTYQVLQIFAIYKGSSYILTYTASTALYDGEVTFYEEFLEKANEVITNLKFVEITPVGGGAAPEYPKDADGWRLISDEKIAGFNLYIPDSYEPDFSSSIVSASRKDGCNVNLSEATAISTDSIGYWTARFDELRRIATDVKLIDTEATSIKDAQVAVNLGEGLRATSIKYSYTLLGKTRCVYQALIVKGYNGYVFTFTAEASAFTPDALAEAQTILDKIEF